MLDCLYAPWFMLTGFIVLYMLPTPKLAPLFGKPASTQQTPTPATATSAEDTTAVDDAPAEYTSTPAAEKFWVVSQKLFASCETEYSASCGTLPSYRK